MSKERKLQSISMNNKVRFNGLDLDGFLDKLVSSDGTKDIYSPSILSHNVRLPAETRTHNVLHKIAETRAYPLGEINVSSGTFNRYDDIEDSLQKNVRFKIADLFSPARLSENNATEPPITINCSQCFCKTLGSQNASECAKCRGSKEMQQKCQGVDLSHLLPIPGETTTAKTTTCCKYSISLPGTTKGDTARKSFKSAIARTNGRGYRKVEESTLDALRRFQLTHGIFAPNEEDVEKAVEKAKIQISKVRNKLPELMKHFRFESAWPKELKENYLDNGKVINDVGEFYKFLPQFKIERVMNEGNIAKLSPDNSCNSEESLLFQNAVAIKKQLETIRQYDVLLANIRAQAQLRLIELADMEAKHHVEEVRCKKERFHGMEELKNMEEVLRQEVKLAQHLPGASSGNWTDLPDGSYSNPVNLNQSEIVDLLNQNTEKYNQPHKEEYIQDSVNRNNKLIQYLDMLLRTSDTYPSAYKDPNISNQEHGNKYYSWEKSLGRTIRNNEYDNIISKINNRTRNKRKCVSIKPSNNTRKMAEEYPIRIHDYDKAFHILQNDLLALKEHLFSRTKSKAEPQDNNVLVQIKVSVDVANSTDKNRPYIREITSNSESKNLGKNKQIFQKTKVKQ